MTRIVDARRTGILAAGLACALAGCGGDVPADETTAGLGPRVGLDLSLGWQEMGTGSTESGIPVYTEGAMSWNQILFAASWGFRKGQFSFEPVLLAGSGTGTIDNGMIVISGIPVADAQTDEMSGSSVGGGISTRFSLADTRARFGLDVTYVKFSSECNLTVDNLPALTVPYNAESRQLELGIVLEYNDPSYRPYVSLGLLLIANELDEVNAPGDPITVQSRDVFGGKVGVVINRLFGSPVDGEIAIGYYSGPAVNLALGYRF